MVRTIIGASMLAALAAGLVFVTAQGANDETARVIALDEQWAQAEDHRDEATLKRILDERFIQTETGEDSRTTDRAAYIQEVMSGPASTFQTLTHHETRLHGDTAIVIDTDTIRLTSSGKDSIERWKCTIVFVKRQRLWRAVAEQCGRLPASK